MNYFCAIKFAILSPLKYKNEIMFLKTIKFEYRYYKLNDQLKAISTVESIINGKLFTTDGLYLGWL